MLRGATLFGLTTISVDTASLGGYIPGYDNATLAPVPSDYEAIRAGAPGPIPTLRRYRLTPNPTL